MVLPWIAHFYTALGAGAALLAALAVFADDFRVEPRSRFAGAATRRAVCATRDENPGTHAVHATPTNRPTDVTAGQRALRRQSGLSRAVLWDTALTSVRRRGLVGIRPRVLSRVAHAAKEHTAA